MQSVPQITEKDVDRVVRRDFLEDQIEEVTTILGDYGRDSWHRENLRVRMAALKLSHGDLTRLRSCILLAKRDYRDLLVAAECPDFRKLGFETRKLPTEEQQRIQESDRRQYDEWLKKIC